MLEIEKEKSDHLLLNILPESVADELKHNGRAKARRYEEVTVLFSDFKNFTGFSDSIDPEEVVSQLDFCFRKFDEIMERHGIEKIKTIGDAYMCAAGLPNPDPEGAIKVIRAARDMQSFLKETSYKKTGKLYELRIGIHTGPVVAGVVGKIKFAYDIWGDTVNIASRMEEAGEVGRINVTHRTMEVVKDSFSFEYRGELEVKGKGKMKMYFLK